MPVFYLSDQISFPPVRFAEKSGLLAVGGDLSAKRLLKAYRNGIFPWYSEGDPILWWSPDPRLILLPEELKIPRSLRKVIKKEKYKITFDLAFSEVIRNCATIRTEKDEPTWLVEQMIEAYSTLHQSGYAHSIEAWNGEELVGGLYGVGLGKCFFGESMFTRQPDASKAAFVFLVEHLKKEGFHFIDCQVTTHHLLRFGAKEISRADFLIRLNTALKEPTRVGDWRPAEEGKNPESSASIGTCRADSPVVRSKH